MMILRMEAAWKRLATPSGDVRLPVDCAGVLPSTTAAPLLPLRSSLPGPATSTSRPSASA
jgi:hypothetical protein